jgi:hypothetical protein
MDNRAGPHALKYEPHGELTGPEQEVEELEVTATEDLFRRLDQGVKAMGHANHQCPRTF